LKVSVRKLTVQLPEALVAEIEAEARRRKVSKSVVVRDRLMQMKRPHEWSGRTMPPVGDIGDLIGSVDALPSDLSARTKEYLSTTGYGAKRSR